MPAVRKKHSEALPLDGCRSTVLDRDMLGRPNNLWGRTACRWPFDSDEGPEALGTHRKRLRVEVQR